jgi:hypothetical protein
VRQLQQDFSPPPAIQHRHPLPLCPHLGVKTAALKKMQKGKEEVKVYEDAGPVSEVV